LKKVLRKVEDDIDGRMENFKATVIQLKETGDTQYIEDIDE